MLNRVLAFVVLLAGLCSNALAQGTFLTGSQVSDQDAYRFVYQTLSVPTTATQAEKDLAAARLAKVGLTQDDAVIVTNQLAGYGTALGNYITVQNTDATNSASSMQLPQDDATFYSNVASLTQGKTAILFGQLSQSGFSALQAYVQAEKANMFVAVPQTPTGNIMSPNYSYYRNKTQVGSTLVLQITTQGSATFSSACIACFSAQHHPSGENKFVFTKSGRVVGGTYNGPIFSPPTAYINYTNTVNVVMPNNTVDCDLSQGNMYSCYGDWGTVSGPKGMIVCSAQAVISGIVWAVEHFRLAESRMINILAPAVGGCTSANGVESCFQLFNPWCINSNPILHPYAIWTEIAPQRPNYVDIKSACFRTTVTAPWVCSPPTVVNRINTATAPKAACTQ